MSYVNGVEFRPDNRRVVHHALVFTDNTGAARGVWRPGAKITGIRVLADRAFRPSG